MSASNKDELTHDAVTVPQRFVHHFWDGNIEWCAANTSLEALKELYAYTVLQSKKSCYRATLEIKDILGNIHMLRLSEIVYLEAQKQSTVVHTLDGSFRLRKGITNVTELLCAKDELAFIRIHRSYTVNPLFVKTICPEQIELSGGKLLPLSARRRTDVIELMSQAKKAIN